MINWNEPKFEVEGTEKIMEVLKEGYVSEGPKTKELEEKLSDIIGCKHVIMTTSCTTALYLAIEADKKIKNYSEGEVVIPDLTFIGTKNAIEMANLKPHIVDVQSSNFLISNGKSPLTTKIIIPVNLLGRSCSVGNFPDNISLIYDNAGCLGSHVPYGKVGCYSLQGNKIISCGQGGFCVTDDDRYAKVIREFKDFGRKNKEDNNTKGFNFKFNDILAAVALSQLNLLKDRIKLLKNQYSTYKRKLNKLGGFIPYNKKEVPLWIEFITKERDRLFDFLTEKGINCKKPWKPFKGFKNSNFYYNHCIWLPNGPTLNKKNQEYIIKSIKEFYNEIRKSPR